MSVAGLVAPAGEVIMNTLAVTLFESPIFLYHIAPIHHGYTSLIMLVLWPTYGFHFYCFHEALALRTSESFPDATLAMIMGIDGIIMEALVNILSAVLFISKYFLLPPRRSFTHFLCGHSSCIYHDRICWAKTYLLY